MVDSYDLSKLDPASFEHLVNAIALRVLGAGHTGFGPGKDGGRDGYFEGTAPYPSTEELWSGKWYIQSKFHKPHLSTNSQQWLREQVKSELELFIKPKSLRVWPTNWILATNIELSGAPVSGTFDKCREFVSKVNPSLSARFHIWGGDKILHFLATYPDVAKQYAHLMTPGELIASIKEAVIDSSAGIDQIIRQLVVTCFDDQQYTKLEQAGSDADNRPGIQEMFSELPFTTPDIDIRRRALAELTVACALRREPMALALNNDTYWERWTSDPRRARTWLIKGGPGQGKSTLTQYVSQINRASIILDGRFSITPSQAARAKRIQEVSEPQGYWPQSPRIPVFLELKEYAKWLASRGNDCSRRLITYLAGKLSTDVGSTVLPNTLTRAFGSARWLFVLDGLDEVPGDIKDFISNELLYFINDHLVGCRSDAQIICTSRPQGYSGQLDGLGGAIVNLSKLTPDEALACAAPVLKVGRTAAEIQQDVDTLKAAVSSPSVREIMTTPLQSHIMAVVIRSGGRPPERKWQLFENFYNVIKRREANRGLADPKISGILQKGDQMLKALHSRLGFELHYRAEISGGANTSLTRPELKQLVREVVEGLLDIDIDETIASVMEATTERLVLVNTPDSGENVRFDIRPLQEFFAAEYIHESGKSDDFAKRVAVILGDSHWREVVHFLFSALVERGKSTELHAAIDLASQLDSAPDNMAIRPLRRRLAVGSIIAGRLLSEGVLEQDKRVRQRFGNALDAIWGCSDSTSLLNEVEGSHSRDWLCTAALSALREKQDPEHIGAALLLCKNLRDGDARVTAAIDILRLKSASSIANLFDLFVKNNEMTLFGEPQIPRWLQDIAFTHLCSLSQDSAGAWNNDSALLILQRGVSPLKDVVAEASGSALAGKALEVLFDDDDPFGGLASIESSGIFNLQVASGVDEDEALISSAEAQRALLNIGGYFSFLAVVLRVAEAIKIGNVVSQSDLDTLLCSPFDVPLRAQMYIFRPFFMYQRDFNDNALIRNRGEPMISLSGLGVPESESELVELFDKYPDLGIQILSFNIENRSHMEKIIGNASLQSLRSALDYAKSNFINLSFMHKVVLAAPEDIEIRHLISEKLAKSEPLNYWHMDMSQFEIKLPMEAGILPHVLAAVTRTKRPRHGDIRDERISGSERSVKMLRGFFPHEEDLKSIYDNTEIPEEIKVTARLLFCMLAQDNLEVETRLNGAIRSLYSSMPLWLAAGAAHTFTTLMKINIDLTGQGMALLLDLISTDVLARHAIEPDLQTWRETAAAPVHKSSEFHIWQF
jgi:hypothetical protein